MNTVCYKLAGHIFTAISRFSAAIILAAGLSPPAAYASTTTVFPDKLHTYKGSSSEQPVEVLSVRDQSGTSDGWSSYIEFYPGPDGLFSVMEFNAPIDFATGQLQSIKLTANFKGPRRSEQRWRWHLWNFKARRWVLTGTNDNRADWRWVSLDFSTSRQAANYMDPLGRLRVRYSSPTATDNSDLDAVALILTGSTGNQAPPASNTQTSSTAAPETVEDNTPAVVSTPAIVSPPATPSQPDTSAAGPAPVQGVSATQAGIWSPAPGTSWQVQFTGNLDTSLDVDMYDIDLFDTPASTISNLKSRGIAVICYFSAGSFEDWRPDAAAFPASVKGNSNGWAGEAWLDIRAVGTLAPIMGARLDLAADKGCTGVDPDNVDGYTNQTGFPLAAQDQLEYNIWLAEQAHARGLSIGLKNNLLQIRQLEPYYDWAMNESCNQYNECDYMTPFVDAGKAVFGIEYKGDMGQFCSVTNGLNFDFLKKSVNLNASREACR
jgi:hypothetical protein